MSTDPYLTATLAAARQRTVRDRQRHDGDVQATRLLDTLTATR